MTVPSNPARTSHGGALIDWSCLVKKLSMAVLLMLVALTVTALPASAGRAWCRTDPLFLIDGHVVDVLVAGPLLASLQVTGPTKVVVTVPEGVHALHLLSDLGFGRGYRVSIIRSSDMKVTNAGAEIQVDVYVPARRSIPIAVDIAKDILGILSPTSAYGNSNQWITVKAVI